MRLLRIGLAALMLALGASTPLGQVAPVPVPGPAPAPADAASGPVIRFPIDGTAPELDPHRARANDSFRALSLLYDTLYVWAPATDKLPAHVKPLLAEDWPAVSDDGLTLTIKLRKGVKFHNHRCFGKERTRDLTARDVVDSLKRAVVCGEDGMGWLMYGLIDGLDDYAAKARNNLDYGANDTAVAGLTAADDLTVVIKTLRPFAAICSMLAHPGFSILPREAINGDAGKLSERALGTGPYRLQAFALQALVIFKRFDGYWGEKPYYARIVWSLLRYWEQYTRDFSAGAISEIQIYPRYHDQVVSDGKLTGDLAESGGVLHNTIEHGYYFVAFNMEDKVWGARDADGRKLRRAVSMALDRAACIESAGQDPRWHAAQDGVLPDGSVFGDSAGQPAYGKQDLDAAKKVLAETKYKGGIDPDTGKALTLELMSTDVPLYNAVTSALRGALSALGMRLTVRYVKGNDYRDKLHETEQQAVIGGWFLDYPDPVNFLQLFHSRNSRKNLEFQNIARYNNPDFDKAYDEYTCLPPSAANLPRMRELVESMTRMLAEDQPTIALTHEKHCHVRSGKIEWPAAAPQAHSDLRYVQEKQ